MTTSEKGADTGEHGLPLGPRNGAVHGAVDGTVDGALAGIDAAFTLEDALVALGTLLLSTPALDDYLARVADLAVQVFDPPATCGVSLYVGGEAATVASSGRLAGQVEETQYEAGDGPCLHSMRTGEVVDIPDLALDERWSEYRTHALSLGLHSTFTVAITDGRRPVGALNVHACEPHAFDARTKRAIELFAAQTSGALALLQRDARQRLLGDQLQEALASRAVIDQAMGIVMATRQCNAEEAFAFLRRTSQNANRKLRDVATDLVASIGAPAAHRRLR